MTARSLLAVALLCIFAGAASLPVIKPSDKVCQSLSTSCEDLWVASSCKVVKSCITEVWEKLDVPLDKSNVCNICKEMVKEARDQLLSNETQEELKEVLEGSCKLIPIKVFADMCIRMVDEFIPDLIDMLVSRMDPDQVCTIAGLCNPNFFRQLRMQQNLIFSAFQSRIFLPPLTSTAPRRTEECSRCMNTLQPAKAIIRLLPEAQVELLALKMCQDHHKDNLTECPLIVKKYFSPVYDYFYETAANQTCVDIRRCPPSETLKTNVPLVKGDDDLTCDFCKQLVGSLRNFLEANTTQDELKQAILAFCEDLGSAAEECQNLLDEYFDMFYTYLLEALEPERFCSTIGLCQTSLLRVPLVKLFPAVPATKVHLQKLEYPKKAISTHSPDITPLVKLMPGIPVKYLKKDEPKKQVECELCIYLVKYVDAVLENKKDEAAVLHALEEACKLVPQHMHERCVQLVDKYVDELIHVLVEEDDPNLVCGLLGLCTGQTSTSSVQSHTAIKAEKNPQDSVECEVCKAVIEFFENNLPEVVTKDVVEYVLDELCNQFSGDKAQECKNLVDKNIELILKYLTGEVAATAICRLAQMCEAPQVATKGVSPDCVVCKELVQVVYDQLKDVRTEEAIAKELERVCNLVPSSSRRTCVDIVNTYFEALVSLILQELTPDQVCSALKFCGAPGKAILKPASEKSPKHEDPECTLCEQVFQLVYNELKDNKTQEEIKQVLEEVCDLVPKSSRQECVNMINNYFDLVVSLILQDFTPDEVCKALGICPPSGKVVPKPASTKSPKVEGSGCTSCKEVVQFIYNELKDTKTEEEIKRVLEEVCTLVPQSSRQECVNMVNTYFDLLVSLILQDFTPDEVCQTLGLCPSSDKVVTKPKIQKISKDDNPECTLCKDVVQFVYAELRDNKTEQAIKEVLDEVCNWVPQSSKQECLNMVSTYFDLLVSLILQDFTPDQICQTLTLCPSSSHGDVVCTFCQYALHFIQTELMDNKTEEKIKEALDQLCARLPKEISEECQAFVEEYGAAVIVLLAQELDPSIVCVAVRACPKGGLVKQSMALHNLYFDKCDTCSLVIGWADRFTQDTKTDEELASVFERVCKAVPAGVKQECQSLVKAYGPFILRNIGQLGNSKQVCQVIDMCPKAAKGAHLLGSKKCTFGPAYWCHSEAHASACNAHEYCKKKVWKQ
ncbi:uncharacterized protein LOC135368770 [Ornithodoros turicata]|uniref:uncharacterized protein LOC135368770 n=1 Tax=Ornithodoros turicata TaxID=34597 RepID=UPI0031397E56